MWAPASAAIPVQDAAHRPHRAFAGRPPGTVGDGDEARVERLQPLPTRFPQLPFHLVGLARKEFEGNNSRGSDCPVALPAVCRKSCCYPFFVQTVGFLVGNEQPRIARRPDLTVSRLRFRRPVPVVRVFETCLRQPILDLAVVKPSRR